ncbi:hypothetical protein ES1_13560 [[Eubacterium] siraeum V10Sc8a]|uniref:Uncharacterized protein n=1 Tax=[Eubacterium] siraeum V10Sc8a TaxID=717961 RepID=D4MKQ5_9FIRM|nr:hypothetical protein ES1_13560 [[Eubacterium] siraeum V10Sc8a]
MHSLNVWRMADKLYRELIIIIQAACGIKRLFGSIGKTPKNQSAHFDNFKSEAEHRLGYFFDQKRITARCRSPPCVN